jgi:putative ABC transport system permease protein
MIDSVRQDFVYALRGFRREPGFVVIAILILALGIGANTAVFSLINPLILRPLPFADADSLVWLAPDPARSAKKRQGMSDLTYTVAVFELLQRESQSFAGLSAYQAFFGYANHTLTGRGDPERIVGVEVAPRFFEVLGVQPALGRLFTREETTPKGPRAMLMTHAFWMRRFGADPRIVGRTVSVDNDPVTVVGVLPESFDFSSTFTPGVRVDYIAPVDLDQIRNWGHTLAVIGRVKPGATAGSAHAELATLMPRLDKAPHPWWGNMNVGVTTLKEHVSGQMQRSLVVLWSAVGLVLLIVCANLSNLLLARAASRRKEIAVRIALGARRGRIVRQLLTEGILLSLVGAALGVPLAYALTAAVRANATSSVPLLHQVRVDSAALLFTAAVAIAAGAIFGTLPAIRLARHDPQAALKEQSRGSTDGRGAAWLRSSLVVAEITLACVLLVGTGLLLRSFVHLLDVDLGFEPSRVFALRADTGLRRDRTDQQRLALLAELVRRVRAIPGVEAVGTTDALPLDRNRQWGLDIPGQKLAAGEDPVTPFVYVVGPGYFNAMGIAIKSGRDFADEDTGKSQPVIVLSETLARRLFQDRDPLGHLLNGNPKNPYRVIGIVADVRQTSLDEAPSPQMYVAEMQYSDSPGSGDLIVRTTLPPASLASTVRATVGALDPSITATDLRPIEMLVDRSVSPRRLLITLLLGFAGLALLLACLGIYGVVSYGVSQRVPEIGVRMALGATAGDVGRQIIGGTMRLAAIGVALGLVMAYIVAHLIASLLFGTSPTDVPTFAGTAAVLALVAIAAGAIPALRAARIDPMSALRAE